MLKIGLTGGIASGKSTVCKLFSRHNIPIIDADIIAQDLVKPNQIAFNDIVKTFGTAILQDDGTLDRQQLRRLIFSDKAAKRQLETILHPLIQQRLTQQISKKQSPYCILAIPLLIEANMRHLVDHVLVIDAHPDIQLKRLCQRDNMAPADALAIIKQQTSRAQRMMIADDIIDNNHAIHMLIPMVDDLHQKYINLAKIQL